METLNREGGVLEVMMTCFFMPLFLLVPTSLNAGMIKDYQVEINKLAAARYSPQELSQKMTRLYEDLSSNFGELVVESDEYDPEKVDYAAVLLYTLAPFAEDTMDLSCDEYQNFLMYGYRIEYWQDMPEATLEAWVLIERVCR